MKLLPPLALAASLSVGCTATCAMKPGDEAVRTVSLHFGERYTDSDEFPGIDEPAVAGVTVDWYRPGALFGYEIGLYLAQDDSARSEVSEVPGEGQTQKGQVGRRDGSLVPRSHHNPSLWKCPTSPLFSRTRFDALLEARREPRSAPSRQCPHSTVGTLLR